MSKAAAVMPSPSDKKLALISQVIAWSLVALVSVVAIVAWGNTYNWQLPSLNVYVIFPLLGLLAYSLMWTHYVSGFIRRQLKQPKPVLARYFSLTSWAVLLLICLHPGLLIIQRYHDGFGFPPHSYETYVAPGKGWVTLIGTTSLLVFLAYELHRIYGQRPWWRYMQIATDAAMLGIFYHSLRLGSQLQQGWFRIVWWFYGITLIAVLLYNYLEKYRLHQQSIIKRKA